jgi:hypothetical protein
MRVERKAEGRGCAPASGLCSPSLLSTGGVFVSIDDSCRRSGALPAEHRDVMRLGPQGSPVGDDVPEEHRDDMLRECRRARTLRFTLTGSIDPGSANSCAFFVHFAERIACQDERREQITESRNCLHLMGTISRKSTGTMNRASTTATEYSVFKVRKKTRQGRQ